jgi:6-pyruvoyltetrahydropterin/6-carboxytetrahydropterin synthase
MMNPGDPKDGMVIDFSVLKKLVKTQIVDPLDHSLMVNNIAAHDKLVGLGEMYERQHLVNFQPTTENMVLFFADKLKKLLPEHLELFGVRLYETSSSYAEWFASDNP